MLYHFFLFVLVFTSHSVGSAVLSKQHQWPQNSELNIVFLDGSTQAKTLVKIYSVLWIKETNLLFRFFDNLDEAPEKTHIRISFTNHTGSQLGNQNDLQSNNPTMNLLDLVSPQISESGARQLILHEFGHALGFEHEFRNPNWPYGKSAIDQVLKKCIPKIKLIGYSVAEAKNRCLLINTVLDTTNILSTAYDENSIMNYTLNFTDKNNKSVRITRNTRLSYLDLYAIQKWFPKIQLTKL
ncbi:MAG: hypothetical protein ACJAS9_002691 [Polaribacter sp.]|jgi:hypothetical protein